MNYDNIVNQLYASVKLDYPNTSVKDKILTLYRTVELNTSICYSNHLNHLVTISPEVLFDILEPETTMDEKEFKFQIIMETIGMGETVWSQCLKDYLKHLYASITNNNTDCAV